MMKFYFQFEKIGFMKRSLFDFENSIFYFATSIFSETANIESNSIYTVGLSKDSNFIKIMRERVYGKSFLKLK